MSAPQIIARALTFEFTQSVSTSTGLPDVLEISVTPLDDGSSVTAGATFAGGVQTATIELSQPINTVVFDLIPTYSPGLDAPINYRVMWRTGIMSRTYSYDFAMLDADLTWQQLTSTIGTIIDGTSYLQQSDLGVPGRVARLDSSGNVLTSAGIICATEADITAADNSLASETVAREQAISALSGNFSAQLATQVTATLTNAQNYTNSQASALSGDIANERGNRINADTDLQTQITTNLTALTASITSVAETIPDTGTLAAKADLVNGTIPFHELPTSILPHAVSVPNQAAMLALTAPTVTQGNIAVRPDGIFFLNGSDPSQLSNWVSMSIVNSVNGYRGSVALTASDVNAIPAGGAIAQSQVTGLNTVLAAKANQSDMAAAQTAISAIQGDTTLVHTTSGTIPVNLLSTQTVYLNSNGQLVNGAGTIIPISGGSGAVFSVNNKTGVVTLTAADVNAMAVGASITQSQVTGLSTALSTKADLISGTVPTAQLPSLPISQITGLSTALSNTAQLTSGLIALSNIPTLPQSQITGLSAIISGNQLTSSTNAINRISSLESQITTIGSGGGGGGGISTQAPFYTSSNTTTAVVSNDFTTSVNLHSPWGIDSDGTITGTTGTWYYLYTGVRGSDVAFPLISQNGHLQLRKWNESGPADPVFALQSDLSTLSTLVGTKATQSDLLSLSNTVNTKANASDLAATNSVVGTLATQANLTALSNTVATKANASDLSATNATVATLATASSVTALTTTVSGKASQTDMTTVQGQISTINTTLPTKADLVSGVLKSSQIPTAIPLSSVTGLTTALAATATLVSGTVPLSQMPQNIPQNYVSGLGTTLGSKADLVGGTVPMSQLPAAALPNVVTVANRGAMLALTTAQVQFGDLVLITATADKGTYVLTGNDPSQFANWTELATPDAPVTGVWSAVSQTFLTGNVVLGAADVSALATNASIPISQITGLSTTLSNIPTTYATQTTVSALPTFSNLQDMFTNSSFVKRVDYATTSNVNLSTLQSIDNVLIGSGALVLLAGQSNSINNGLWIASGGSWTRPADYQTGKFIAKDTIVIVTNQTAGANGTVNNNTVWQMTGATGTNSSNGSGFVDSSLTAWTKIANTAPPFAPAQGNGISITYPSNIPTFAAQLAPSLPNTNGGTVLPSGLTLVASGLAVDPVTGVRKYTASNQAPVLSGSSYVILVNHNLNTLNPTVSIWQTGSNTLVLAGVQATSYNQISIEFATNSGTYNIQVLG